jgi:hypothetical protein
MGHQIEQYRPLIDVCAEQVVVQQHPDIFARIKKACQKFAQVN